MGPDLVTVGGLTVDHVITEAGDVGLSKSGGNGAYSAVGALLWQCRVGLVSCAVETYPKPTLSRLEHHGIDLAGVAWSTAKLTAGSWFIYDKQGRREEGLNSPSEALSDAGFPTDWLSPEQIVAWRAALIERQDPDEIDYGTFRTLNPLTVGQIPADWQTVRGAHIAPSSLSVMLAMSAFFEGGGTVITADPGWQLAEHSLDEITPLLSRLDAFLPSEVELRALVPGANNADALRLLAQRCRGAVTVKLGPEGCLVWNREAQTADLVPIQPVKTLDPTGAGDGFSGGYLAGLVETGHPFKAAQFGAISAARIVSCFGADGPLPHDRAAARALLVPGVQACH
ncbi:MAG: carbohydrate kinase family protein [Pseudomonadota bacterium]